MASTSEHATPEQLCDALRVRTVLNEAVNAAVKTKESIFEIIAAPYRVSGASKPLEPLPANSAD